MPKENSLNKHLIHGLRLLIVGILLPMVSVSALMADDTAVIKQRLSAMGMTVCAVNPMAGGVYKVQVGKAAARGAKQNSCPFSIDARFDGGVLTLDKESVTRAGLVFTSLPPGVKIASQTINSEALKKSAVLPPTDLSKMTQSLDRAKAMKTEALAMIEKIKTLAAQATTIIDSCPTPNIGEIQPSMPIFSMSSSSELLEPINGSDSCNEYLSIVTTVEGNCRLHRDNIKSEQTEADQIQKYAADRCSNGGLSSSDRQSLKNTLNSINAEVAGDIARIDTLIARIETLIVQYNQCLKSNKQSNSTSYGG